MGTLEPGDEAKVIDIPLEEGGDFVKATISFRDADIQTDGSVEPLDAAARNELVVWFE